MQLYFWLLYQPSMSFTLFLFPLRPTLASTFTSSCTYFSILFLSVCPLTCLMMDSSPRLEPCFPSHRLPSSPVHCSPLREAPNMSGQPFCQKQDFALTRIFKINKTHVYIHKTSIISQNIKEK